MEPLTIAYIMTPVEFGGAERVNLNFLRNVDRAHFSVVPIVLIRPWEQENIFIDQLEKEKYTITRVPVAVCPPQHGKDYFRVLRCFRIIYSILRKNKFDLVHTHGYFADIVGILAARLLHIPVVSTCHGFISNGKRLEWYNLLDRLVLRFADRIIAVSDELKTVLVRGSVDASRIVVIVNAVDSRVTTAVLRDNRSHIRSLLKIRDNELVIGYVGRLSKEKGVNNLILAGSMLRTIGVPARLLIIGDGPDKRDLEHLVIEYGLASTVTFAGFQVDVERWIAAFDIFCLPSLSEGTPMSLLEAMALGVPALASSVGGIPRIIKSGHNGVLVSPDKPEDLKDAILSLYENRTTREQLSTMAKHTVIQQFGINDWCRRIEQEYLEVIKSTFSFY